MIKGIYFDGKTSDKKEVLLTYDDTGRITFSGVALAPIAFDVLTISSRIGNTPRYISLPTGAQFETEDNDAVDQMVKRFSTGGRVFSIHYLESTRSIIISTILFVVLFAWLFIQYGIPHFSRQLADMLPEEATRVLGQGVLDAMDDHWFDESELAVDRQAVLQDLFKNLADKTRPGKVMKLEFRKGGLLKANAFALPDGTIVFTDELIQLAKDDMEIAAIMLHEMGHLENRDSVRSAIQQFSLAMFVMVVTGDVSTSSSVITAIPFMLVRAGYSQEMEWQADSYAYDYMKLNNMDTNHFANIMASLEASHNKSEKEVPQNDGESIKDYFSSHPASNERIKRFRTSSQNK
ncbi:MAG: M48 family metallopeptidase [Gammaproteobacteria bacterium]|nr:M48 family metallopeptidase [Gammaproteobacteria bacterium]MCW9056078.1 M48 family metallopeptidase [Gammaproteobacteria bacterium]